MEVHHHTHPASGGARKKWIHYFWEFLMLFLAVTLGFFVENQREHYIEKLRAKEFAKSLAEDLKTDTLYLADAIHRYDSLSNNVDSFLYLLKTKNINEIPGGTLYYYGDAANSGGRIPFSTATIQQLKSSGSLRYFPETLRNLISLYDLKVEQFNLRQNNEPLMNIETRNFFLKIFKYEVLDQLYKLQSPDSIKQFMSADFDLLNNDPQLIKEYANDCFGRMYNWRGRISDNLIPLKRHASSLIGLLKEKYHLK